MKKNIEKFFALIGICLLGILMGVANAATAPTSDDCDDDDVQPAQVQNTVKATNKNT